MSNYSTFFPQAAGGSTEITDPDKIPKVTAATTNATYIGNMFYTLQYDGNTPRDSDNAYGAYFPTNSHYQSLSGGQVSQTSDNTEITLANVTSGSGYLCCVVTPVGGAGATQEIKITVDGGTEKVYTIDYSSNDTVDNYYTRLVYGFSGWGSPSNSNRANYTPFSILGLGGAGFTWGDFTYPPLVSANTSSSVLRLFTAHEFKNYGFPRLRFDSSIVVKCKTNGLHSTSGADSKGIAIYYLDSQL